MNRPRVLLADDHASVLATYRQILLPEFELVETVSDGQSLLASAERWKPDVIVTDISMPLLNGVEACRRLRRIVPGTGIILVSIHGDAVYVTGAFQAGASGYVLKHEVASELPCAIRKVFDGQAYITPSLRRSLWDDKVAGPERLATLTDRQRQVVMLAGKGLSTKEIASAMGISFKTAVRRRSRAMHRLQITQPVDLVRFAIRCRLLPQ